LVLIPTMATHKAWSPSGIPPSNAWCPLNDNIRLVQYFDNRAMRSTITFLFLASLINVATVVGAPLPDGAFPPNPNLNLESSHTLIPREMPKSHRSPTVPDFGKPTLGRSATLDKPKKPRVPSQLSSGLVQVGRGLGYGVSGEELPPDSSTVMRLTKGISAMGTQKFANTLGVQAPNTQDDMGPVGGMMSGMMGPMGVMRSMRGSYEAPF